MNLLIDSHAHLTDEAFAADLGEVLDRAASAGIERVVTIAETLEDASRAAALAHRWEMVVATAGVHPHKASLWHDASAPALAALLDSGDFVAVGEIGLDFHYNFSRPDQQRRAFREQLAIAREHNRPVVLHCREAYGDLLAILEEFAPLPAGVVVHCFSGTMEDARRVIELGLHIGVTGVVTFKKADGLRRIVAEAVPLNRLLIETDCPYLAPEPYRGKRNEPAFVRHVAEKIAEVLSMPVAEVAAATRRNALALFRL